MLIGHLFVRTFFLLCLREDVEVAYTEEVNAGEDENHVGVDVLSHAESVLLVQR